MSYSVNSGFSQTDPSAYDYLISNSAPSKYNGYPSQYDNLIDDTNAKQKNPHCLNEFHTVSNSHPVSNIDLKHKTVVPHESGKHASMNATGRPTMATFTPVNHPSKAAAAANKIDKAAKPLMFVHPSSLHSGTAKNSKERK